MSARPIPPTSELTQPYWDAARDGTFVLQRCDDPLFHAVVRPGGTFGMFREVAWHADGVCGCIRRGKGLCGHRDGGERRILGRGMRRCHFLAWSRGALLWGCGSLQLCQNGGA